MLAGSFPGWQAKSLDTFLSGRLDSRAQSAGYGNPVLGVLGM